MTTKSIERSLQVPSDTLSALVDGVGNFHVGIVEGKVYVTVQPNDAKPEDERREAYFTGAEFYDLLHAAIEAKAGER